MVNAIIEQKYIRESGLAVVRPPDTTNARVVAGAGAAEQETVPTAANLCRLTATANCAVLYGENPTAVYPAADVTDGTASPVHPAGAERFYLVKPGEKFSVIPDGTNAVVATFEYWKFGALT